MFARIADAIARAIASMTKDFWYSLPKIGKTLDDVIRWPFSLVFGGGGALPHYEPTMARADVGEVLKQAREKAAASVHAFDPSGNEKPAISAGFFILASRHPDRAARQGRGRRFRGLPVAWLPDFLGTVPRMSRPAP